MLLLREKNVEDKSAMYIIWPLELSTQDFDCLCVLLCLVFGFQDASGRVKALEGKLTTLTEERDSAKQNVRDAIHAMKAAADDVRQKVKSAILTLLAEDSSRHTGLSEVRKDLAVYPHA